MAMNEKIKAYSSTITAIFSAAVVLYGVFKFINQSNINTESNKAIKQELIEIKQNQVIPMVRLDSIESVVRDINGTVIITDKKVDVIRRQFTNHLTKDKSVTKEELMQIINELNEKKN